MARRDVPWRPVLVLAAGALLLVLAALLARRLVPRDVAAAVPEAGAWAIPLYVLLFVLLTLTFLPTSPLSVAGGFLFGPWVGLACAWTGAFAGGAAAFALGRSGRRPFREVLLARVPPVARLLERHPFAAVLASRLLFMPHGPASYGLGLAGVRPRHFLVGTGLGLLPLAVAFVLVGAGVRDAAALRSPAFLAAFLGALVVTALGAWLASRPAPLPRLLPAGAEGGQREAQALSRSRGMGAPDHEEPRPERP